MKFKKQLESSKVGPSGELLQFVALCDPSLTQACVVISDDFSGDFFIQFSSNLAMFSALDAYAEVVVVVVVVGGGGGGGGGDWRIRLLVWGFESSMIPNGFCLSRDRASQRALLAV